MYLLFSWLPTCLFCPSVHGSIWGNQIYRGDQYQAWHLWILLPDSYFLILDETTYFERILLHLFLLLKGTWKLLIMEHGSGNFHNKSILSFSHSIFFRIIGHNLIFIDAFLLVKIYEFILNVLSIIFRYKYLNFLPCFIFNQSLEFFEQIEGLILMF